MTIMTGLSGNEIYCLQLKELTPGEIVIGNSVHSIGFLGGIGAGLGSTAGGEVTELTEIIGEGRFTSQARLIEEARRHDAYGITGVTSELRQMQGSVEFLSVGSCLHGSGVGGTREPFSTSLNGQELYCLLDAGYRPKQFVMGNIAYSVGLAGGLFGAFKSLGRGEIREYSDIFNATRHLALRRIAAEAQTGGANAVVGIETRIMPFRGAHEMLMIGTAAHHPALGEQAEPVTSDLTCEEMWNLAALGYMPLKLVLGTAVYSVGLAGSLTALFKSVVRGELTELTSLIYDAREHAIGLVRQEASAIGADDVIGVKTYINDIGGLIEFMAIGTAVKRVAGAAPASEALPVQAIIKDKDTWIKAEDIFSTALRSGAGARRD